MEIRQAAALYPDPQGQARRSARRRADADRCARPAARFWRRVLFQGIRRAATSAQGAGAAAGLRAAGRRDRQVGRRVRVASARNPVRLPSDDPRTRHHQRYGEAAGAADLERRARLVGCAEAALPASAHRLPRTAAGRAHRRKPRARRRRDTAQADGRIHQPDPCARSEEAAVGQRNDRLGAGAGAAAGERARPPGGEGHAQRAVEVRSRH